MSWLWRSAEQNGVPLRVDESLTWADDVSGYRYTIGDLLKPFVITPESFPCQQYTITAGA